MRQDEDWLVSESLSKCGFNLKIINATEDFHNGSTTINNLPTKKLFEVINPEIKRKIIGDTFIKVIMKEIESMGLKDYFLAQGTLRPDLIESASTIASSKADVIKTHHNDTQLVREKREQGLIIEPLKDYHKDEVRMIGKMLNLPELLTKRHPFPGPGLAIRILCHEGETKIENNFVILEKSLQDKFNDLDHSINLLPIHSVGVQGDGRSYSYVSVISGKQDWNKIFNMANKITQSFHNINRVVYLFGDISKITTTRTFLEKDTIQQIRQCDYLVNKILFEYDNGKYINQISQFPVILIPISFENINNRSVVLRPFITNDFMTGVPAIPNKDIPIELINKIISALSNVERISRVLYDITSKPPGTTEWE
jgi:GMP synthase (glutamine-hydrolysing)